MNNVHNDNYYEPDYDEPNNRPERDPDDIRDERIDAELLEGFKDIEIGTQVEILEKVLK